MYSVIEKKLRLKKLNLFYENNFLKYCIMENLFTNFSHKKRKYLYFVIVYYI